MADNHEVEASQLARQVEEIEKLIRLGKSGRGYPLAALLDQKQARLDAVRNELCGAEPESKERKSRENTAVIAYLVERETKLNAEEKEQYSRFLEMDYFRRRDLNALAVFYKDGGGYDRLTDEGKAQMSQRIEESIRKGELTREELPTDINRKNNEVLGVSTKSPQEAPPEKSASDEADASKINAGEKGSEQGVEKINASEFGDLAATFSGPESGIKPTDIKTAGPRLSRS